MVPKGRGGAFQGCKRAHQLIFQSFVDFAHEIGRAYDGAYKKRRGGLHLESMSQCHLHEKSLVHKKDRNYKKLKRKVDIYSGSFFCGNPSALASSLTVVKYLSCPSFKEGGERL